MSNVAYTTDSASVAERVRELMSRHGIGKRQQTTELCRILDLSFSQGHRKLRGNSPWTLAQIKKVAEAFGEPAGQLFGAQLLDPGMVGASAQEAILCVSAAELPCTAWIGAPVEAGSRPDFVAYEKQGQWRVVRPDGALYQNAREVHKIEIYPRRAESDKPLIAVVDDDRSSADNLRDYLEHSGYTALALYGLAAFNEALENNVFDGVVIDWLFGSQTAAEAIRSVRASENPDAPIFVLTGELLTGKASESEISLVVRHYNVACYEKPARMAILVADLSKRLNRG
ncbi:helix-turn-helix domain-containing protein [Paraburkholderia silvatlantica]|uniref:CheY-like chemotaxis protein n=1 Tax=Paraburkholderia silvatlantica TaxID=321895 RepID=A0A2U1ABR7_9BURK|nr:helix-turn-helix domain-containing protein [Paraburkholderia silvatlantica]MBB2930358.1 CheY-like chemotaxis protein [Paraburkholderia silvatlantica]PVY32188.1 response regulator receiver protein [Paraburkholderia silvatlantica]PXW37808.1 response regulator receiver protein [Paraburkholderia silvatlantica]PYE25629.1 response regulator receiver protein [Paraburkholderia silvatlantica]TDQ97728.1 response regulator receiver protein [Paraburkholderia silvatlantica]